MPFATDRYLDLRNRLQAVQNRPGHVLATPAVEGALAEADLFRRASGPYADLTLDAALALALSRLQLTYEGLAEASQAVGLQLHASTVSRFSRGVRGPTLYQVANLCPGLAAAAANLGDDEGVEAGAVVGTWIEAVVTRTVEKMWG